MSNTKLCQHKDHTGDASLPIEAFNKYKRRKDGLDYYCRECRQRLAKERYKQERPALLKKVSEWQQENKDRVRKNSQSYRDRNKEKRKEITKKWRDKSKPLTCFLANKRRAQKLNATPAWAETPQIKALYEEAARLTRDTGIPHEVDHIVPLQSDVVCGLHCLANLRIITKAENIKKTNKLLDLA